MNVIKFLNLFFLFQFYTTIDNIPAPHDKVLLTRKSIFNFVLLV